MKFFNIKAVGCKVDIQKLNHFPICQLNTYVWFEAKNKITDTITKNKIPVHKSERKRCEIYKRKKTTLWGMNKKETWNKVEMVSAHGWDTWLPTATILDFPWYCMEETNVKWWHALWCKQPHSWEKVE